MYDEGRTTTDRICASSVMRRVRQRELVKVGLGIAGEVAEGQHCDRPLGLRAPRRGTRRHRGAHGRRPHGRGALGVGVLLAAAPEDASEARPQGRPGPGPAGRRTHGRAAGRARVAGEPPLEGLELVTQGGHRLVPVGGVLGQRAFQDALERRRGPGVVARHRDRSWCRTARMRSSGVLPGTAGGRSPSGRAPRRG